MLHTKHLRDEGVLERTQSGYFHDTRHLAEHEASWLLLWVLGEALHSHAQGTETWRKADRHLGDEVQMSSPRTEHKVVLRITLESHTTCQLKSRLYREQPVLLLSRGYVAQSCSRGQAFDSRANPSSVIPRLWTEARGLPSPGLCLHLTGHHQDRLETSGSSPGRAWFSTLDSAGAGPRVHKTPPPG